MLVDSEPKVAARESDILEGIDTTLSGLLRLVGDQQSKVPWLADSLKAVEADAKAASDAYDVRATHKSLPAVAAYLQKVGALYERLKASALPDAVKEEVSERIRWKGANGIKALQLAQGLTVHATADDGDAVPGQTVNVNVRAWNRTPEPVRIDEIKLNVPEGWSVKQTSGEVGTLAQGAGIDMKFAVTIGDKARYSQPYWKRNFKVDRYDLEVPAHDGLPWSPADVTAMVMFTAAGTSGGVGHEVYFRYEGPWVGGEKQKVLNVVPALNVSLTPEIAIIPVAAVKPRREFRVAVSNNFKGASDVKVRLEVPAGWTVDPPEATVNLRYEGEEITSRFFVSPPSGLKQGEVEVRAVAVRDGQEFREGYQTIAYEHIQERHLFHPAASRVKAIDAKIAPGISVGYVKGAGDEVPPAIEQLGAKLTFLTPDDIAYGDLSQYTTIVTGIRAYQTRADLKAYHQRLMNSSRAAGTWWFSTTSSSSTTSRRPRRAAAKAASAAAAATATRPRHLPRTPAR
jgi:hypothetical protein